MTVLAAGFPNPFEVMGQAARGLLSPITGPIADAAADQVANAVSWLVESIIGAMVDLSVAVLGFFWDAAEPDPSASWFSGDRSAPYGQMVVLAAPLFMAFFLAGVIQGALKGDVAGMLRMALVRMPGAVLAMSVTVAVTDMLLKATNEMSEVVLGGFRDDVEATTQMLGQVSLATGMSANSHILVGLFGLVGLVAAVVLLIELFVRGALIYIVLALCPLIYAASVWESLRGTVRKLGELGLALILSKFVIAVALALSAAAMTASWDGSQTTTELATPELTGAAAGAPLSQLLGTLVSAIVMFAIAAFMPFVLFRLLPLAEGALVAQGIKSSPLRIAQQGHYMAMMARHNPAASRLRSRGGGPAGAGPAGPANPGPAPGPGPSNKPGPRPPAGGGGGGAALATVVKKGSERASASAERVTATYRRGGAEPPTVRRPPRALPPGRPAREEPGE